MSAISPHLYQPYNPDTSFCGLCDEHVSQHVNEASLWPNGSRPKEDRRCFPTGAERNSSHGKGRCDLLPSTALLIISQHYEKGADKFGADNWRKGFPMSSFFDSAIRHLLQAKRGDIDEDHLAAAAWNVLCAIETRELRLGEEPKK